MLFLDRPFPGRTVAVLTVGLAGDASRDGLGDVVFDEVCELSDLFVPGASARDGL